MNKKLHIMYADDDQDDAYLFHAVMSDIVPPM